MDVRAYFLTFGTYGSRLHGDERETWVRKDGWADVPQPFNPRRARFEATKLKQDAVRIAPEMRTAIEATVVEVCQHRGWLLLAMNVRLEHVHAVVVAEGVEPERVVNDFKAYATRRMREMGLVGPSAKVWARHASTNYLFSDEDVEMAVDYTLNHQGARLQGSWWKPQAVES